jgi:tetratricopeptide (TPR) repeat protein
MSPDLRCPSCGHENPADATQCAQCNYPLREGTPAAPAAPGREPAAASSSEPEISIRRIRPIRPRRPSADQQLRLQLWLVLGTLAVGAVLYTAWQGYQKNNAGPPPVEGAQPQQQQAADLARTELARDSTNLQAQIALANVLYDTANWTEAIVHYRSALRLDSTRVTTMVDLGVCYYNLSRPDEAEELFQRALKLDPQQPVALFNMGIVSESRQQYQKALDYYHDAIRAGAPSSMAEALNAAMQRVMKRMGRTPSAPGDSAGSRRSP